MKKKAVIPKKARAGTGRKPAPRPAARTPRARSAPRPAKTADGFNDFVADQLDGLGEVELRAMFGGHGIYLDGKFFGIVHKSRLYFRVGPATIGAYRKRGMKEFNPYGKPLTTYYEVPPEVQEVGPELKRWAQASARTIGRATPARVRSRPAPRSRTGRR
jgi:DNA transformation protein